MKTYKEASNDAKDKRRAKPSGKIHKNKAKKSKTIRIQRRYVDPEQSNYFSYTSDFYSREWVNDWSKYARIKDAKQAVKTLNRKEANQFEYRIKPTNPGE